jgi:hypothetical protein
MFDAMNSLMIFPLLFQSAVNRRAIRRIAASERLYCIKSRGTILGENLVARAETDGPRMGG